MHRNPLISRTESCTCTWFELRPPPPTEPDPPPPPQPTSVRQHLEIHSASMCACVRVCVRQRSDSCYICVHRALHRERFVEITSITLPCGAGRGANVRKHCVRMRREAEPESGSSAFALRLRGRLSFAIITRIGAATCAHARTHARTHERTQRKPL